jgi:hypothetical protein
MAFKLLFVVSSLVLEGGDDRQGNVARVGETTNAYRILVGKPEGKRPLGRPRHRWVDNIKMNLREIGWDGMVWTGSNWFKIGTSGGLL